MLRYINKECGGKYDDADDIKSYLCQWHWWIFYDIGGCEKKKCANKNGKILFKEKYSLEALLVRHCVIYACIQCSLFPFFWYFYVYVCHRPESESKSFYDILL